jgi:hypothetical protein
MKKKQNRAKYHAINDMNKLNLPVYLLKEFNDRRAQSTRRRR